jgi:hypothetical protein
VTLVATVELGERLDIALTSDEARSTPLEITAEAA